MNKISTPADILKLAIGYQKSQTLFTFVELEIPKFLQKEQMKAADIGRRVKIHPLAMERFLNACVAIGILEKDGKFYKNSDFIEEYFLKENDFYLGGQMKRYQKRSYLQWANLTENLKSWKYGKTATDNPEGEDQGAEAMVEQHNLALLHGTHLADNYDFSDCQNLLDVGGGTAAMSIGICQKVSHLQATVFDLPENIEKAEEFVVQAGLKDRIKCVGGDIIKDDLPENCDVVLLANLLAVFDVETNKNLFKKIYDNLPDNGKCLISGWILDENMLSPEISVLFCLEDICWNAPDVERNHDVYKSWLSEAGFKNIDEKTYFEPTKLISAEKR
jgi:3-hydroxy-5-methyl-1-naphthoate 3-O-methyltransferase